MDRCQRDPLIDVRQGWQLQTCGQNGDAVEATVVNDTGDVLQIRAGYLVGCDGASSRVRNELGIAMEGAKDITEFALVHFRSSDLTNLHALASSGTSSPPAERSSSHRTRSTPGHCTKIWGSSTIPIRSVIPMSSSPGRLDAPL